jgi:hypothetical protein
VGGLDSSIIFENDILETKNAMSDVEFTAANDSNDNVNEVKEKKLKKKKSKDEQSKKRKKSSSN